MQIKKTALALLLLTSISAFAETPKTTEVKALQNEIKRQELVLDALKQKLAALEQQQEETTHRLEVSNDTFILNNKVLTEKRLEEEIQSIPPNSSITIVAEKSLPHARLLKVMDLCGKNGITKIAFSTKKTDSNTDDNS